jgi:hypothetical protein
MSSETSAFVGVSPAHLQVVRRSILNCQTASAASLGEEVSQCRYIQNDSSRLLTHSAKELSGLPVFLPRRWNFTTEGRHIAQERVIRLREVEQSRFENKLIDLAMRVSIGDNKGKTGHKQCMRRTKCHSLVSMGT